MRRPVSPGRLSTVLLARLTLLCLAGLAAVSFGCGDSGGGGGGGGPTDPGRILQLRAEPATILPFGNSRIVASVRTGDGAPIPASQITLSTDLGLLFSTVLTTDDDGLTETVLQGEGVTGVARISGQLASGEVATVEVQIGGAGRIVEVRATPETIAPTGESTLLIRVLEASGAVVPDARLAVATDLGRLDTNTLTTDAAGSAITVLRGNGAEGTATVTVTVESDGTSGSTQVLISSARRIDLTATPQRISSTGESRIVARVLDADGNPVGAGIRVQMSTDLGRLQAPDQPTSPLGIADTTLEADGAIGVATVTATAERADPATVEVVIGADLQIVLSASPATITAGTSSTLTAVVSRGDGSSVGAGTVVEFRTTRGTLSAGSDPTDASGTASVILTTGTSGAGDAVVTASLPSLGVEATVTVMIQ
ncbi:MAG: hypothetical protein AAGC60_08050 [Acidobacteriota bacterium]